MLQLAGIYPETFQLLKKLMAVPEFSAFNLVGGTSLALQYGHRISIDLDLFGNVETLEHDLIADVLRDIGKVELQTKNRVIHAAKIDGVKVDIVKYRYPLIKPLKVIEGIRLASSADIGAMKLNAIIGRGVRKDFIDLYFLLQEYSLTELINFYEQKHDDGNVFLALRSLLYFEDAMEGIEGELIKDFDWESCKELILSERNKYLKNI